MLFRFESLGSEGMGLEEIYCRIHTVTDSLEAAVTRARTIAAPMNTQRFALKTPCSVTGVCGNCKAEGICNQLLITRNCKPQGRIKVILVGEELGL